MTGAILLAGGAGLRLGGQGRPKQYVEIGGKPMIEYALDAFEACAAIDKIAIVASEEWRDFIRTGPKFAGFAPPGPSRQASIHSALSMLRNILGEDDVVAIHDAARPLVTEDDICACLRAIRGYDGATPVLPPKETIYRSVDGETITALLNRDELFAGQTPEAYRFGKYLAAHERVDWSDARGSSEVAFKAGMKIRLYPGNPLNFKVTDAADLDRLRLLPEGSAE